MNLYEEFKLYEKLWDEGAFPKAKSDKPYPEEFFRVITGSEYAVKKFIKELLAPAVKGRANRDIRTSYHNVIAANTNIDNIRVANNELCNFSAFSSELLRKFNIDKEELRLLIQNGNEPVNQNPALKKPRRYGHDLSAPPKAERPTPEEYFEEMTSSKDSIIDFIQRHLAPAVAGRVHYNVSGAYYNALAKNTCEVSANVVQNTACNFGAFKRKLDEHSISKEELSTLLNVESNSYTPSQKPVPKTKKEKILDTLRTILSNQELNNLNVDDFALRIYNELEPIIGKTK